MIRDAVNQALQSGKEGKEDDYMNGICNIEQNAFFAGANMVLDFISGKEVQ